MKNLELDQLPTESALGIKWNTEEDMFVWDVSDRMLQVVNELCYSARYSVSSLFTLRSVGVYCTFRYES